MKYVEQGEDPPASRRMVRVACEDVVTVTAYVQAIEALTSLGEQFRPCRRLRSRRQQRIRKRLRFAKVRNGDMVDGLLRQPMDDA